MSGGGKVVRLLAVLSAAGLAVGAASATVGGSTGGAARAERAATPSVRVKLIDFKLLPGVKRVAPGKVTFVVRNAGAVPHELVVLKTSTPAAKLAVKSGKAIEAGKVAGIASFKPGVTKSLTLRLKAGHYVLLCNLPGHYTAGQFADFTVGAGGGVSSGGGTTGGGTTGGGTTGGGTTGGSGGGTTTPLDPAAVKAGDLLYHTGPASLGYGCARCHGETALGGIGPKIVGSDAAAIKQAIGIVAQMQSFSELSDQQIQQIAAYLKSLQE